MLRSGVSSLARWSGMAYGLAAASGHGDRVSMANTSTNPRRCDGPRRSFSETVFGLGNGTEGAQLCLGFGPHCHTQVVHQNMIYLWVIQSQNPLHLHVKVKGITQFEKGHMDRTTWTTWMKTVGTTFASVVLTRCPTKTR